MPIQSPLIVDAERRLHCYKCNRMVVSAEITQTVDACGRTRNICRRCHASMRRGDHTATRSVPTAVAGGR